MFLLLLAALLLALSADALSAPRINVSKLKTDQSKMKASLTRYTTREQAVASKEALLPKFGGSKGDKEIRTDNGFTFFELLVRRAGSGPWLRYQDLLGDDGTEVLVDNVVNGGVENELWRERLDEHIKKSVFGVGLGGDGLAIAKVKGALPQLKKLRPRDFQFGYRIAVDDEPVYSIERSTGAAKTSAAAASGPPPPRLDVAALMALPGAPAAEGSAEHTLTCMMRGLCDAMAAAGADSCVLFSDGSATPCDTTVSGGEGDGGAAAPVQFATASSGVYLLPMRGPEPLYGISRSVRVQAVAGLVDSPFDAELVAGLSAVTLAAMMAGMAAGAWVLHTDSKTLARAVRTGPQGDLADRASASRLALWRLLDTHTRALAARGRPVDVVWTPGHPERRDSDRTRWTPRDVGIWVADEVAKDAGDGAVVLEGLVTDGPVADGAPRRGLAKPKRPADGKHNKQNPKPKEESESGSDAREPKKKITAAVAALREEQAEEKKAGDEDEDEPGAEAAEPEEAEAATEDAVGDEVSTPFSLPVPVVTITGAELVRLSHAVAVRAQA